MVEGVKVETGVISVIPSIYLNADAVMTGEPIKIAENKIVC